MIILRASGWVVITIKCKGKDNGFGVHAMVYEWSIDMAPLILKLGPWSRRVNMFRTER
jgi:hypothetical protein